MIDIKKLGLANLLTLFRIVCIPIFVFFMAINEYTVALVVFGIAAYTDLIDGTVARLRKEKTQLGALLDPFADKGLMLATFISLAVKEVVPMWFIYIILLRDVVVVSGYFFLRVKDVKFKYRVFMTSKFATLFETITGILALVYLAFPTVTFWVYPLGDLVFGAVMVTSVLILIATLQYLKYGIEIVDKRENIPDHECAPTHRHVDAFVGKIRKVFSKKKIS